MRKRYTAAFKAQIVQEVLREEKLISGIASAHGIHPHLIGQWKAQALQGLPSLFENAHATEEKLRAAHEQQLTALYAEIGRLTTHVAWLKKKSGIHE